MNVADVMTRKVISVTPETTIAEAAQLLLRHRISGLPVVGPDGAVLGIVTEGDLLRRVETGTQRRHARWLEFLIAPGRLAQEYTDANARKVGDIMTSSVVSVAPRSEEHTSELQSRRDLVCRLLLEKKKTNKSASSSK